MKAEDAHEYMHHEHHHAADERFKKLAAILVGILAMFLAINGLGGANAGKEMLNNNVLASNTYAFYQAKTIRQTVYRVAADELEIDLLSETNVADAARDKVKQRLDRYRKTIDRYDTEPETGEGRKELLAKAALYEARRDHAQRQDPYFDFAEALFQIAIVLCSVSLLSGTRMLLGGSAAVGVIAVLFMLNGYFLFADVPFLGEARH